MSPKAWSPPASVRLGTRASSTPWFEAEDRRQTLSFGLDHLSRRPHEPVGVQRYFGSRMLRQGYIGGAARCLGGHQPHMGRIAHGPVVQSSTLRKRRVLAQPPHGPADDGSQAGLLKPSPEIDLDRKPASSGKWALRGASTSIAAPPTNNVLSALTFNHRTGKISLRPQTGSPILAKARRTR